MRPTVIINVAGLTPRMIGPDAPNLQRLAARGGMRALRTVTPAVTCSVQATFLTGTLPNEHGIVGNGWYSRPVGNLVLAPVGGARRWREALGRS
jgi:predicted AlkP superfamily pyrophosphatase or phosphodiesterase